MSADGTHVAIGAPCKELSCMTRGKAYVFAVGCDASTAPTNGGVGTCTSSLASGSTCQPTCNSGYTVSGTSSCSAGTLTAATCAATSSPSTPTETANTESGGSRLVLDSALTLLIGTTFMLY